MSHQGDTPEASDDVPHIQNTIRRNGVYYFNARYPRHLSPKLTKGQTHVKRSLKTKDWKEAKAKATRESLRFQLEVEKLEAQFEKSQSAAGTSKTPFESLSDSQRNGIILRWFIERERQAELTREKIEANDDDIWKAERIVDARADLASLSDHSEVSLYDWKKQAKHLLDEEGIIADEQKLTEFTSLLRRAHLEISRRSAETFGKAESKSQADPYFVGIHGHSSPPAQIKASHTIGELCDKYQNDRIKSGVTAGTISTYPMQFLILKDFLGDSLPISAVDVEQAQALADFLGEVPKNATKLYPGLNLKEAAKREKAKQSPAVISPKTQRDHLQGISSIFKHAVELGWLNDNPISKRAVSNRLPEVKRKAVGRFSSEELARLFSLPDFTANQNHPLRYPRYWVPLLCFFHGLRANEAAQLLVDDVKVKNGIHYLHIREENEAGEKVKQLKTAQSSRRMPLANRFLDLGFLEFVSTQREQGEVWLFSTLSRNKRGSMADGVSKWFSRIRKKAVIGDLPKGRDKTLHSFRHSFRRAGNDTGIPVPIMESLGGWQDNSNKSSENDYGDGHSLKTLKSAIELLTEKIPSFTVE